MAKDPNADIRNRGDCVFPSGSKFVDDAKDHFPINDKGQARNALSRVSQYDSLPAWATGLSLSELQKKVRNAVKNKYPDINVSNQESKKSITFDDKFSTVLKESNLDLEKGQAKITAIEKGWSENDFYYTDQALTDIAELLNSKGKMFVDHVSEKSTTHGRTLFEWAATVDSVMKEAGGVTAVIDFTSNPKTEWLKEEAMKHPGEIQFSINASGKAKSGSKEGKEGYIVESVKVLKSVDLVDYAAAGGELQAFKASVLEEEDLQDVKKYIKEYKDLLDNEQDTQESIIQRVDDLEAQLEEAVDVVENLTKNKKQNKEVDYTMKLSELKDEQPELLEAYRDEIEDDIIEDYKESKEIVEKIEAKDDKIEELESTVDELKESKQDLEEKVSKFEMKEAINDRKQKVQELLENSKLNVTLNKLPESVENSLLDLDREEKDIKEAVSDLEEFAANDDIVSGHGDTSPVNDKDNDKDEELDLTENDDEALDILKS